MGLFSQQIEIAPTEGFTPDKDIFGRKSFGEKLTRIIRAIDGQGVVLLDAPWGTGKTIFIKMWRGELSKAGISSIYFDAFANDYQEDAFLAIASEIIAEADKATPQQAKVLSIFKHKTIQTAKVLGRAALKVGIRAASAGVVEVEDLGKIATEIAEASAEEGGKALDKILEARLESHESDEKVFAGFRASLTELAINLSSKEEYQKPSEAPNSATESESTTPLVFIIDELDRCRPTFTLQLLEKIKHFFSVPKVIFVLVSSLPQLEAAVRFAYGEIDAPKYLEKFYQLRILFPTDTPERPDLAAGTFLAHLQCNRNVAEIVVEISKIHFLSFRTLEHIATYAKLAEMSLSPPQRFLAEIMAVLCVARVIHSSLYDELRRGRGSFPKVHEFAKFDLWRKLYAPAERSGLGERVEDWWCFVFGVLEDQNRASQFSNGLFQYGLEASKIVPFYCHLIDGFSLP